MYARKARGKRDKPNSSLHGCDAKRMLTGGRGIVWREGESCVQRTAERKRGRAIIIWKQQVPSPL